MAEKLTVKNFAGITDLEIEIKRINILIGPQASGKSVCAKLLFYFKNFVWEILSIVENEQTKRNLDSNYSKKFEEYFPPNSWGKQDFFIRYELANIFIEVSRKKESKGKIVLSYSELFNKEFTELRNLLKKIRVQYSEEYPKYDSLDRFYVTSQMLREIFVDFLVTSIGREAAFSQLFIPAGRSFFANLQNNIFSFLSSNNALDPFLREFGSIYENIKRSAIVSRSRLAETNAKDIQEEIDRLIENSLCGKHVHEKGKDFLEVADGRRISIANSSSGQQETLPLTIMLAALPFLTSSGIGQTVYIEEPEAHLFPSAQRNVVELIATVFNYRKEQLQFFITTHSPYVLTAFNNLLQAGLLYQESSEDVQHQLEKIVSRYKSLDVSDLSAYVLMDGKCSSIVCPETGLIDAKVIDSVSDDLAIEFEQLLNLV
ncbi:MULTISPECIES: AAA family ATPase [unclassified Microcoleus]|uniref:AAA family ATPase n=1 Tax=unclassified Microcoleus TaxID=2642155 RepID=UPI002FD21D05